MKEDASRQPWSRFAAAGLAAAAAAALVYAAFIEPRRLEVRRSKIHVRRLPRDLEGLRIAVLSDLHAGRFAPRSLLRRAVRRTMAARPHLIALTGDFINTRPEDLGRALDAVRGLRAPLGVYAVPGNHDRAHAGPAAWAHALEKHPRIRDLTNRHVLIGRGEATLCIAGVDDLQEGRPRLRLPPADVRDFTLLLAHNPDQAEQSRRHVDHVDLVVAGHTHGGQIRVPGLGPLHRKSTLYDQGLRRRPWTQVYTSRGLGTTFLPLRFNARPEVSILELTATHRPRW